MIPAEDGLQSGASALVWRSFFANASREASLLNQVSTFFPHPLPMSGMPPYVLERHALLQRALEASVARVVLAQGPAGHGKTTFLRQVESAYQARGIDTLWLSLDAANKDDTTLLARYQGLQGQPLVIFLDDLHQVVDGESLAQLQAQLMKAPAGVRWFLASRTAPALDLTSLLVNSQLLWLRAADLRWGVHDTDELLNGVGQLGLDASALAWLHSHTDGWPALLQLYRQALQSCSSRRDLRAIQQMHLPGLDGYLRAAVLAAYPAHQQTFLLRCAVLDHWSVAGCNAVLGGSEAAQNLGPLMQDGLVQRRSGDSDGYVLAPVLLAFLRKRLHDALPGQVLSAHLAAAGWHEQQGWLEEAVHHYLEGGDEPQACEVFNTWLERLLLAGDLGKALAVAERLPAQRISRHPVLTLKLCWVYALAGQRERLDSLMPALHRLSRVSFPQVDPSIFLSMRAVLMEGNQRACRALTLSAPRAGSPFDLFELCMAASVQAGEAMAQGELRGALEVLNQARSWAEQAHSPLARAYAVARTSQLGIAQGQLKEALVQLRAALSDLREQYEGSVALAPLACTLITALYEANAVDEAMACFHQFHTLIAEAALPEDLVMCYRCVTRIHDANGHPERALELLDEGERLAYARRWPRAVQRIQQERVRRALQHGHVACAQRLAQTALDALPPYVPGWTSWSEEADGPVLGALRLMLHSGQAELALVHIECCLDAAVAQGRVQRQIKLYLLAALAQQALARADLAQRCLDAALRLAAPGGHVGSFLEEGSGLMSLLRYHEEAARSAGVAERGLAAKILGVQWTPANDDAGAPGCRPQELDSAATEPLTKKERMVLALLVKCMSNSQIAEAMFVSRETVKFHLKNIYAKLGVRSRLELIRSAAALSIV